MKMRQVITSVFCFFICISSAFSQIDTISIQGIDCYNDTGFIKLALSNTSYVLEADDWEHQPMMIHYGILLIPTHLFYKSNQ